MKQNLPPAKLRASHLPGSRIVGAGLVPDRVVEYSPGNGQGPAPLQIILLTLALVVFSSACIKLALRPSAIVQYERESSSSDKDSVININSAAPQELEKLPGVGKGIAERIVAHRTQYGPFRRAEHLLLVRGISDRKFRALRPLIAVD